MIRTADEFVGQHVVIVGGGISAIQLLDEISRVTRTTWVTRRPSVYRSGPFDEVAGRAAVRLVEERVRRGLPPQSVVSVTGIPVTSAIDDMRARGVLKRLPMFSDITEDGVRWPDGTVLQADVILWCTGFRSALDHLAPLPDAWARRRHCHERPPGDASADTPGGLWFVGVHNRRQPGRE